MSDQEVMFYMAALITGFLAVFILAALSVFSVVALQEKLNGGEFFKTLLFCWAKY